jgi:hypothetical protein
MKALEEHRLGAENNDPAEVAWMAELNALREGLRILLPKPIGVGT